MSQTIKLENPERKLPKPPWLRVQTPGSSGYRDTRRLMRVHNLRTVCEEAACPNIGECWSQGHATVMILGDVCTRRCAFCNVATGRPKTVDPCEPDNLALSVSALGLTHVVITSVDRDDLRDGGAYQFVRCIKAVRRTSPSTTIEVLTPDFIRKNNALESIIDEEPDIFNHNLETVPRLYPSIRPGARYSHSLRLLERAKERNPSIFTKSGIMVGLGEKNGEVHAVMDDMRTAGVDFLTIGQYLRPTLEHAPVARYVLPAEFDAYERVARDKGFLMAAASPLTRSSYHAGENFRRLKAARAAQLGHIEGQRTTTTG